MQLRDASQKTILLKPFQTVGKSYLFFCSALLLIVGWAGYAWYLQLTRGLGVTAMNTPVGATWGVYIVNFVFFACMAHGGMAISAAVHLFKVDKFKTISRMGEVLTIVTLAMAGFSIVIDMGRPDRVINMITFWGARIGESPLTWDVTVIILYFVLSASYFGITIRRDMVKLVDQYPLRGRLYKLLLVGYRPEEGKKIDRLAFWLSIAIVFLIVMLSGGVIPWIFGLLPAQSGWFGSMAGPYFLTAALASSVAAIIVVGTLLRKMYGWQEKIKQDAFRLLSVFLGCITAFYIYLTFAEQITMRYSGPEPELVVSEAVLAGNLSPVYWGMMVVGFFVPALVMIVQAIHPKWFSLTRTAILSAVLIVAFWIKRFFIIVPSLLHPLMPFPIGSYRPTWIEWSIVAGTFALAILLYSVFLKLFPIVEVHEE